MSDRRDELLAAIRANPADDSSRLALADWCDANGEVERAEFIRVEIEREGVERDDPRWDALNDRARTLRKSLAIDAKDVLSSTRRGFHSSIATGFAALADGIETIGPWCVALTVLLGSDYGSREDAEKLRAGDTDWRLEAAKKLFASHWVREWRSLEVQHMPGTAALIDAMFAPGNLANLQGLGFVGVLDDEAFALALRADLPELTTLAFMEIPMLDELRLTRASLIALAESSLLGQVTTLQLSGPWVDDEGLRVLAQSPHLERLTTLSLPHGTSAVGRAALLSSPHLRNLQELDFGWTPLDDDSAAALARPEVLPALKRLTASSIPDANLPALRERFGEGLDTGDEE